MRTRYHYFEVAVPEVEGVGVNRWRQYIEDAVASYAGSFEPAAGGYPDSDSGDPLGPPCEWRGKVKVKRL